MKYEKRLLDSLYGSIETLISISDEDIVSHIPVDENNSDYQKFLLWEKEGNVAEIKDLRTPQSQKDSVEALSLISSLEAKQPRLMREIALGLGHVVDSEGKTPYQRLQEIENQVVASRSKIILPTKEVLK